MQSDLQPLVRGWMFPCCMAVMFIWPTSETSAEEKRIYQTDQYGNVQYHKPSYTVRQDGRVIETDPYGNKQYHKPQYQIKGDKVYQTDPYGSIQYHKPRFTQK